MSDALSQTHEAIARRGPVSFAQAEMVRRLAAHPPAAPRYDLVCAYQVVGHVDVDALSRAFRRLGERHEALRTVLLEAEQLVLRDPYELEVFHGERRSDEQLGREYGDRRHDVDDVLAGEPLFRPALHLRGDGHHLLVVRWHHLIYDGLSLSVAWRDLSELYVAERAGARPELPELVGTYLDFALEQRHAWPRLREPATRFWAKSTDGLAVDIDWPQAGHYDDYDFRTRRLVVAGEQIARLRGQLDGIAVSPFLVLLTATGVALSTQSGLPGVLLGTDLANRSARGRRRLIGLFLNTRVTPVRVGPGTTLRQAVTAARDSWLAAEDVEDAYIDQSMPTASSGQLVHVLLDPGDALAGPQLPGAVVSYLDLSDELESRHWRALMVNWVETATGFEAAIRHRPSMVREQDVVGLARRLQAVLASDVDAPLRPT